MRPHGLLILSLGLAALPALAQAPNPCARQEPGKVTLHRLNRTEFDNTVRDLLGDTTAPARSFPVDDFGHGFDNNADVLSLSPLLVEKYADAAEKMVRRALQAGLAGPIRAHAEAESAKASLGDSYLDWGWVLHSNGDLSQVIHFPATGEYILSARAAGQQAGPDPCRMSFSLDGLSLGVVDVAAPPDAPQVYQWKAQITEGRHTFSVDFTNDYYEPSVSDPSKRDRNMVVDWFRAEGPAKAAGPAPNAEIRAKLLACASPGDPAACQAEILGRFAKKAWRRPVGAEELARLNSLADGAKTAGKTFDEGIALAFRAILVSPNFLFRVELDPPNSTAQGHGLTSYELATRLSYFLWSSMPDDELLTLADAGGLKDSTMLQAQIERLIKDPRAQALVDNFVGQWLYTRGLSDATPDKENFSAFDEELRMAMKIETSVFFRSFLVEDKSLLGLFDADYTYVNERLARHYGIPGVSGVEFRKVGIPDGKRGGVLTQASVLTVTSNPTRTSPVRRGKWILDQLLCDPPAPPPPGISGIKEERKPSMSLKKKMEEHRRFPICASCHASMDALGFGLENYDGIGSWRDHEGPFPVDSTGELADKRRFAGARELSALIKADPRTPRCLVQRLFTYALGRGVEKGDSCFVDRITQDWAARGHKLKDLITLIVFSEPFRARKGEPVLTAKRE